MNITPSQFHVTRGPLELCSQVEFGRRIQTIVPEKLCTIATVTADGLPECAVVGFAVLPDGELVLHTHKFSRKWANLHARSAVALSVYSGAYAPYFQVEGTAELFDSGPHHEYLESTYIREHPKAAALSDMTVGTIQVVPRWVRYYAWPRESGHCTEWLIDEPSGKITGDQRITLRCGYISETGRAENFAHNIGARIPESRDLTLLAEVNGTLAGVLSLHAIGSGPMVLSGPHTDLERLQERIGEGLVKLALQIAGSRVCFAVASVSNQAVLLENGFAITPLCDIPNDVVRRLEESKQRSDLVVLSRRNKTFA